MNFELRKWSLSDVPNVFKYSNNKKITDNLRNAFPYPYRVSDAQNFVEQAVLNNETFQCCRAITVNGEAVGSIGLYLKSDVYRKSAEIAYWLAEPYWGKGIMSAAIKQICRYAFEKYDIVRIYAQPYAYNTGSCRALEKAGFVLEGIMKKSIYKNGQYHDSCMYALVK